MRRGWAVILAALWLASCSPAHKAFRRAEEEARQHRWDQAVLSYSKAVSLDPDNTRYDIALTKARFRASQEHFDLAKKYLAGDQLELAISELQATVLLDPSNQYAADELREAVSKYQESRLSEQEKTELEQLKERMQAIGTAPPKLDPTSNIPIDLNFKDQEIGKIYDALARVTGINFFFDDKLDLKKRVSIDVARVPFEKAMDILMLQNKHFYKVLDENSIVIADDNRQKRQEYEDEVIQTFFLSNADVKNVQTILRTLLDARKVAQNDQLNAITIRDSPEKVAIAQRIVEANDKTKAELVIDVELLQINRSTLRTLGIDLTQKSLGVNFMGSEGGVPLNNLSLVQQSGAWVVSPIPGFVINFLKSDSDSKTIAKPQLRVTEGEKANLHIGDRVPIPTTTFNTTGTVGTSVVPITSFTYQEVGIIIEVEPRVHHNKEVTLNLSVELSEITGSVSAGSGVSQPVIGSREITTVIRLKDGETNLLAGLVSETTRTSLSGVPGLSDIPVMKRLFGSTEDEVRQTDIVLTMTPHIIRIPDIRERDLQAIWIGREGNLKLRGSEGSAFGSPFQGAGEIDEAEASLQEVPAVPAYDLLDPGTLSLELGREAAGEERRPEPEPREPPAEPPGAAPAPSPGAGGETSAAPPAEPLPSSGAAGAGEEAPAGPGEPQPAPGEAEPPVPEGPPEPLSLAILPPVLVAQTGGEFNLVVSATGARNLRRLSFLLEWEEGSLEYRSAQPGSLLAQGGRFPTFQPQRQGSTAVRLETALPEGSGASGSGPVALARFRAVGPGSVSIRVLDAEGEDAAGSPVEVHGASAKVTVN